jgi:hypothetical protein
MFAHESDRSLKPLFETGETELSGFRDQTLWFYQDRRQSGAPPSFDVVLLLRPSDIWMVERHEP